MSANLYKGKCFICGKVLEPKEGDFQSRGTLKPEEKLLVPYTGRWLVRCRSHKGQGNKPLLALEKKQWKPKVGEEYWFIKNETIHYTSWYNFDFDRQMLKRNLICRTKKEAQQLLKAMLQVAKKPR